MSDALFYKILQGDDWEEQVELANKGGSIPDLTGCAVELQIFRNPQNPVVLLDLSTAEGTITLNGSAAQINWLVPASQTATFTPSPGLLAPAFGFDPLLAPFGFYILRVKWPNGRLFRELSGQVALSLSSISTL